MRLGDQAWGNGNWDPSGAWDDRYPTRLLNSRTVSIEHHDNGGRTAGSGKGVVPEAVIVASIALDALLLRGDLAELKAAGIRFRAGTETAITHELRAIPDRPAPRHRPPLHLRSDGTFADGRHRKLHLNRCEAWGPQARYGDETWEVPVLAQVAGLTIDDGVIARVVAALGSPDRPVGLERARIERQMRDLALDHVAERIDDSAYLERIGQLRTDLATLDATPRGELAAKRAVEWLRVLADTWVNADVPEARADLLHAIYDRIIVAGRSIVAARLTPAAYSNGLAVALPQVVMARPEVSEFRT